MIEDLKLSISELELIKQKRSDEAFYAKKERFYNAVLNVSNEFLKWKKIEGLGLTYSTFIDDFDCNDHVPAEFQNNLKYFYNAVKCTLDSAANYANDLKDN